MIARSAPLLAAMLAGLAGPALAQGVPLDPQPPLETAAEAAPPPPAQEAIEPTAPAAPAAVEPAPPPPEPATPEPSAAAPAPEIAAAAVPPPPGVAEGPTAQRAIPAAIPPSPFTPEQRTGWLGLCRNAFLQHDASLGGGAGQPDACESQLVQFERSYVPSADGAPPVIPVRVPITRRPAPAAPVDGDLQ